MSGAKITLITPPYDRIAPGYEFVKHVTNRSPSLGLLHLAAEVRRHGYRPSIIESDVFGLSNQDVADRVVDEQPPYVGITSFTVGVWSAAAIARKIKAAHPRAAPDRNSASFSSRMTSLSSYSLTCPVSEWRTCTSFQRGRRDISFWTLHSVLSQFLPTGIR